MTSQIDHNDKKSCTRKIINSRFLFYGFLALLLGVAMARKLFAGDLAYILITVFALGAVIVGLGFAKNFKMMIVIVALFFVGNGLFYAGMTTFEGKTYEGVNAVVGRVSDQIKKYDNAWYFKLDNVSINGQSDKNMMVYVYDSAGSFSIEAGDRIAFESQIENVNMFKLGSFQASNYRKNAPYRASLYASDVVLWPGEGGLRYDESIRLQTKTLLQNNMSQRNAAICYSILFGDKSDIDEQTFDEYNELGIIHILTVSGLHVGFLVALLFFIFKKCNKYVRFSLIVAILLLYNILCGFAPSVMRATIMSIVMLVATMCGRQYDSLSSLSLAGFIIVLLRPLTALDNGFLMSYFCIVGIILLSRPLFAILNKFLPSPAAKSISVTLAAQIGILPIAASFFSVFNFMTVFANMIVLPALSIIFPLLFVVFVLGLAMPFVGICLHLVDWAFVAINYVVQVLTNVHAIIYLKPYPIAMTILFCLFVFAASRLLMIERVYKIFLCAWLVFGVCVGVVVLDAKPGEKNSLFYLDTYPQSAVYVVNDEGESLLIAQSLDGDDFAEISHLCNINSVDYVVTLQQSVDEKILKDFSPNGVAYPNLLSISGKSYPLAEQQTFDMGQFRLNFEYVDQKLVGVSFKINNFENFFATNGSLSYNIKEKLSTRLAGRGTNFVFLNRLDGLDVDGATAFSTYSSAQGDYAVKSFGNIKITFSDTNFSLRCID